MTAIPLVVDSSKITSTSFSQIMDDIREALIDFERMSENIDIENKLSLEISQILHKLRTISESVLQGYSNMKNENHTIVCSMTQVNSSSQLVIDSMKTIQTTAEKIHT